MNARMKDSTETRTVFTNQWLDENGATAFLRASQSGDIVLMKLLLAHGADPKIDTALHVTALQVAAGIGWVEGITYEWSPDQHARSREDAAGPGSRSECAGRHRAHRAAWRRTQRAARPSCRCWWTTAPGWISGITATPTTAAARLAVHTWEPVDYADGLVRVGVQSAIPHPETGLLIRKLMTAAGLPAPPMGRTLESICITDACE